MAEENKSLYEQLIDQKKVLTDNIAKWKTQRTDELNKIKSFQASIAGISCRTFCNGAGTKDVVCTTAANLATLQSLQDNMRTCTRTVPQMGTAIANVNQKASYDNANAQIAALNTSTANLAASIKDAEAQLVIVEADLANALGQSKEVLRINMTPEEIAAMEEAERKAKMKKYLINGGLILVGVAILATAIILTIKYAKKIKTA